MKRIALKIIVIIKMKLFQKLRAYSIEFILGNVVSNFFKIFRAFLIYHFLFDNKVSKQFVYLTNSNEYISYVVIGVFITMFSVTLLVDMSRMYINEIREGTIYSTLILPYKPRLFLWATMIENVIITLLNGLIIIILMKIFGIEFTCNFRFLEVGLLWIISIFGFFGMACLLGAIMMILEETYIITNTVILLLYFVCGVIFPIEYLPNYLSFISKCLPMTYTITLMRNVLFLKKTMFEMIDEIILLAIVSLLYYYLGYKILKKQLCRIAENTSIY